MMRGTTVSSLIIGLVFTLLVPCVSAQVPEALYYKFNEGSGTTTANDAVPGAGFSSPAFPAVPPNWVTPGHIGGSHVSLVGDRHPIQTGWFPTTTINESWTVEVWLRKNNTTQGYFCATGSSSLRMMQISDRISIFNLGGSSTALFQSNAVNWSDGNWHHFAVVYDAIAGEMRMYQNGVLDKMEVRTSAISGGEFIVGGRIPADTAEFSGEMDEFRFWLHARTQAEIQANMNNELGGSAPVMSVERNNNVVTDGGSDNLSDVSTLGQVFTYEIHNSGTDDLNLTGTPAVVVMPGAGAPGVNITVQPALTTIPFPAGSTTFQVEVAPSVGPFDFTVSIDNDDPLRNPYTFTVFGNGVITNLPAEASLPAGSAFSVIAPGQFAMSLDPGQALANAVITLDDPESDDINITAVTPTSAPPLGIVAPSTGIVASPHALTWTGDALASNAPGNYTWLFDFEDVVNGTSVRIEVTITINDLPPVHVIAAADAGDGSSGNPYTTVYNQGDDQTAAVDLATVTDPNTSQNVTLANVLPGGSNPAGGTGFAFVLSGGMLTIAPDGAPLNAQDMGTHTFNVEVTDGTNPVNIHVEVVVIGATGAITFDTPSPLPSGRVDQPYSQQIAISGATGTATFSITSGALPAGLNMNAQGQITGTPTTPQQSTFTVRVIDSNPDTATATFELTINPKPIGGSGSSGGSSGCSGSPGGTGWLLALLAAVAAGLIPMARRRRA